VALEVQVTGADGRATFTALHAGKPFYFVAQIPGELETHWGLTPGNVWTVKGVGIPA
jgi:hypothetical protein